MGSFQYEPSIYPAVPRYVTFSSIREDQWGAVYKLVIAHWFIVLLYVVSWFLCYVLWQRRTARLMDEQKKLA